MSSSPKRAHSDAGTCQILHLTVSCRVLRLTLAGVCHLGRFMDPNDPSKVFLTSPVPESQRIPTAPQYAPNFQQTQNEAYQDMGLRP